MLVTFHSSTSTLPLFYLLTSYIADVPRNSTALPPSTVGTSYDMQQVLQVESLDFIQMQSSRQMCSVSVVHPPARCLPAVTRAIMDNYGLEIVPAARDGVQNTNHVPLIM